MKCPGCEREVKNGKCVPCKAVFLSPSESLRTEIKRENEIKRSHEINVKRPRKYK